MNSGKKIRIHYPGQNRGWGLKVWREMITELACSKELLWRLFLRNFKAKYRQTILGVIWAIVTPLLTIGVFVFLNHAGVIMIGEVHIPYLAYGLLGLTLWHIFAGGLVACSNAIVADGTIVVKINFPKETLVISSMGETLVEMLIRLGLTIAVFVSYKVIPAWTAVFLPLTLVPLLLLTVGLGLMLSLLNVVLRDVSNIVSLSTTFLLFVTPVLYPEPNIKFFKLFTAFNPLAALISGPRDLVVKGFMTQPVSYAVYSGLSLIIFLISWRLFHLTETRIAERVGAR